MNVVCADCKGFFCRTGTLEATPEACPMRGDFPDFEGLYPEGSTRDMIKQAAVVEGRGYCRWTRLRELAEFALLLGHTRIGLPHCPDMAKEAAGVSRFLLENGLEPALPPDTILGDPEAQARFFQDEGTALNVLAGMCVGHEAVFIKASHAPVVSLIARDTRLHHNPVAGIYTSRSYLKAEVFGHWPKGERPSYRGMDSIALAEMACGSSAETPLPRSRLAEALDVAHHLGVSHMGITFCVGFKDEAKSLTQLLKTNGFQVSSVCCKTGSTPKEEIGISDEEKVRPGQVEMVCNPVAQAELLNRDEVQFVFVLGQCVGHDAATLQHLKAPAIVLVAKDRVLAHNTVAALQAF